ncbi:helix-turn-helix transcriptional regulator [Jiangella gansuensis]|uniref:helix-turn-helix transcriptional regulator n=1 Tax=Jiangella gansuensis TaxID=281473 RepID=UPI0004B9661B|nr:AraC family transcriptional regulator [Jiangella gansuensis]
MITAPDAAGLLHRGVLLEWYEYPPGPPVTIPRHTHETYQLNLNLDLPGGVRYRGAYHVVPAESLTIVMPGEAHTPIDPGERDRDSRHLVLYVDADAIDAVTAEVSGSPSGTPFFREVAIADHDTVCRFATAHAALAASSEALERDVELLTLLAGILRRHASVSERPARAAHRAVRLARDFLHAHRSGTVSLADLARACDLSPYHLTRLFTAAVGMPPHAYQLQLRVDHAKRLLLAGWAVSDAAHEAGFFDLSHFTRHFKRFVGVPPGTYARLAGTARTYIPAR